MKRLVASGWIRSSVALLGCAVTLGCAPPKPAARSLAPARFGRVEGPPDTRGWLKQTPGGQADVVAVQGGVAGDRVTSLLEVPEGDCAVAIARATQTVDDLDLFAYGEDGAVLGSDEGADKTPALLVCPPHPRRILLMARIAAGYGFVAIGAQRVGVTDAPRVAAAYGVHYLPGEVAKRLTVWPGLEETIEAHRRRIGGRWIDVRRAQVPLDARTPTRVSASVDGEHCLDALVIPSDEVSSLDAVLTGEDGKVLGRAESWGRERSLVVCSPVPASVTLELRPRAGIGVAVAMFSRSIEGSEADIDAETLRLEVFATGSVADERKRHDAAEAALGYPAPRVAASGNLPLGRRLSFPLELPDGCVHLDWVSGSPLRGVEAWLYAADGSLLANDDGGAPRLYHCGPAASVRLDAASRSRPGPFALELYPEPGTPKLLEKHPLAASRLLARMLASGLITRAKQVGAVYALELSTSALTKQALTLPFGRCLDATAAIGPGGSGVELRLVREDGTELGSGSGDTATSVHACAVDATSGTAPPVIAELRLAAGSAPALLTAHQTDPRAPAPANAH